MLPRGSICLHNRGYVNARRSSLTLLAHRLSLRLLRNPRLDSQAYLRFVNPLIRSSSFVSIEIDIISLTMSSIIYGYEESYWWTVCLQYVTTNINSVFLIQILWLTTNQLFDEYLHNVRTNDNIRRCRCQDKKGLLNVELFFEITLRHKGLKSIRVQIRYIDNRMTMRSTGKLRQLQKLRGLNEPFISKMAEGAR